MFTFQKVTVINISEFTSIPNPYSHISEMPDDIFNMLKTARVKKYMKACKEINIAFIPYEEQVFSLDTPETFRCAYSPNLSKVADRDKNMERMAEQVATLCATLGEYPSVRYRKYVSFYKM